MSDSLSVLHASMAEFEATMERVRKCSDLPEADLRGKYKKAYAQLIDQAIDQANKLKDLMAFGGFFISDDGAVQFNKIFRAWSESVECAKSNRIACRAVRSGDTRKFYGEIIKLRDAVRSAALQAGAKEDPLYRMNVEAIE